jgi:hypothetical protein
MAKSTISGPLIVYGNEATPPGTTPPRSANQNPDAGPSMFYAGTSILDPRPAYTFYPGQTPDSPTVLGWLSADIMAVDFAPLAAATANIAALQGNTINVPLTLATVSAGDITVGDTFRNYATGATVTALRIGPKPAAVSAGYSSYADIWNPATVASRAVSITSGTTTLAGITYTVVGYDVYGQPQTEAITGPGAGLTVVGKKTWKWIASVTPSATNAATVSVGTADVFGFPIKVDSYPYVTVYWNNVQQLTATITPADATSPATTITGDVRGTFTPGSASNGIIRMVAFVTLPVTSVATTSTAALITGMFGVTPV